MCLLCKRSLFMWTKFLTLASFLGPAQLSVAYSNSVPLMVIWICSAFLSFLFLLKTFSCVSSWVNLIWSMLRCLPQWSHSAGLSQCGAYSMISSPVEQSCTVSGRSSIKSTNDGKQLKCWATLLMMSTDLDSIFSPHFSRLSSSFFRPRTSLSSFQVAQARRQGEGFEGVRSEPPFGLQKDFKHHLELCILISVHRLIKSGPLASMLCLSGPSGRPATELMRHSCPNKSLSIFYLSTPLSKRIWLQLFVHGDQRGTRARKRFTLLQWKDESLFQAQASRVHQLFF